LDRPLKLLIISYNFPPDVEVGGLRVARFASYLPEFGIQPIVLTIEDRFRHAVDLSIPPVPGLHIKRTEVKDTPVDWYRRAKDFWRTANSTTGAGTATLALTEQSKSSVRRNLAMLLQFPGAHSGWFKPAVRMGQEIIRKESVDAILSSSPPGISHRIALRLKKRCHLPWLADFRDPWAHSAYWSDGPVWWRYTNKLIESRCVQAADRVICNTEWLRDDFVRFYAKLPPQQFVTVTNGFEDSSPPPSAHAQARRPLLVLHLGSIYALRRIDTFCSAVNLLVKAQKIDPATFKIVFLGHIDAGLESAARRNAPELFQQNCVEFRARVNRQEAQQTLWSADILLLFQGSHTLQIPAKFYEYLPTGRPIFAVAQKGALTDALDETEAGIWADPEKTDEIAANFMRVLTLPRILPIEAQQRWYKRFHYRSLTGRLAGYIRDATGDASNHGKQD
jgi:hypothetical protein